MSAPRLLRRSDRSLCGRPPQGQRHCGYRNQDIQRRANLQRSAEAQQFNEKQRHGCAGHRPQHIGQVKKTEGAWRFLPQVVLNRQHAHRDSCAHKGAPRNQGERDAGSGNQVVGPGRRQAGVLQQGSSPLQFVGNNDGRAGNCEFRQRIDPQRRNLQRVAILPDQAAAPPRTQPQACHEHGKHDRDQRTGDPKLRHRQPQPDDLVEKAAKSRDEKEDEEPAQARISPRYHRVRLRPFPSLLRSFRKHGCLHRHFHLRTCHSIHRSPNVYRTISEYLTIDPTPTKLPVEELIYKAG